MKTYIYGAGGHAKVILDILKRRGISISGIVDDSPENWGKSIHGTSVIRFSSVENNQVEETRWIIAIGDNVTRKEISERMEKQGHQFLTAIHPSAQIGLGASIGCGTVIMANCVINADTKIGCHTIINTGATIDHDCCVNDYVHIAPGCSICGGVEICEGALLGVGTKVKPAMKIGAWAICGAGSVVVSALPSHVLAYGCPARVI